MCVRRDPSLNFENQMEKFTIYYSEIHTCEVRFGNMFLYHAHPIMNFLEGNEINLPYFLLHSLRKMVGNIQRKIQSIDNALYHHGILKMLIEDHLRNIRDNWEYFIITNHFKEE